MNLDKGTLIIAVGAVIAAVTLGALSSAVSGLLSALAGLVSSALWQFAVERRARVEGRRERARQAKRMYAIPAALDQGGVVRYLRPEAKVVPFWPRPEIQQLLEWANSPATLAVQLVIGEGGTGKTRLILQLAEQLVESGWHVAWVPAGAEISAAAAAADIGGPALLVLDYSETRSSLEGFLSDIHDKTGRVPRRVVFLARGDGEWWQRLINRSAYQVSEALAGIEPLKLGPLEGDSQSEAFHQAVSAFAKEIGISRPSIRFVATSPNATVLTLHASALLAVVDSAGSQGQISATGGMNEALSGLLRHEARYWEQSQAAWGINLNYTTQRRTVAAASLLGASDEAAARHLIARVAGGTTSAQQWNDAAQWLHELYPAPASQMSAEWMGQIQPDLMAEHLVVSVFSEWPDLIGTCFAGLSGNRPHRALTTLARAALTDAKAYHQIDVALAADTANLATAAMNVAVETNPQLAVHLGKSIASAQLSLEELERLTHALPFPSAVLSEVAILMLLQLTRALPAHSERKAAWLVQLSNWLAEKGDEREEALSAINEAVVYYRELAREDPDEYKSALASAINSQSNCLSGAGRDEEALKLIDEAVALRRSLVEAGSSELPLMRDLAVSLNNQSNRLSDLGRSAEAYAPISEAVSIERLLAEDDPQVFLPILGASLNNLSNCLAELDRPQESLAAVEEAVEVYRRLMTTRPDAFTSRLAASLVNLSCSLSDLNRQDEALRPLDEALQHYRRLAIRNPDGYLPGIALLLSNKCEYLVELRQYEESLIAGDESVAIRRSLAEREPRVFAKSLSQSLHNLGNALAGLGRTAEAKAAHAEAARLTQGS